MPLEELSQCRLVREIKSVCDLLNGIIRSLKLLSNLSKQQGANPFIDGTTRDTLYHPIQILRGNTEL